MEANLAAVADLVRSAELSPECRSTALWCLARLPQQLDQFTQTYESRYADEVVRLEQGVLRALRECKSEAADSALGHLRALHEAVGLPAPAAPPSPPARPKSRKKSA